MGELIKDLIWGCLNWLLDRIADRRLGADSKTDFSDCLTEEEKLRIDMRQRKSCLDKRM